tara:strand:- start:1072 stop:1311 length:240 start_codon:yes stop_codon:yes gene_type:complete
LADLSVNQTFGLLVTNAKLSQLSLAKFQVEVIESDIKIISSGKLSAFKFPFFLLWHIETQYRRLGAHPPFGRYFLNIFA